MPERWGPMTEGEFVALVLEAERQYDSDFLAWRVEEICAQWRESNGD